MNLSPATSTFEVPLPRRRKFYSVEIYSRSAATAASLLFSSFLFLSLSLSLFFIFRPVAPKQTERSCENRFLAVSRKAKFVFQSFTFPRKRPREAAETKTASRFYRSDASNFRNVYIFVLPSCLSKFKYFCKQGNTRVIQ